MVLVNGICEGFKTIKLNHILLVTFSGSSAYADSPGFIALNVSWANFGASVNTQRQMLALKTVKYHKIDLENIFTYHIFTTIFGVSTFF